MAYNTTGKSHSNGIEGEKTTKNLIENRTNMFGNSPKVEHRGGTSHKEDLLVNGRFKISAKNREGATGTYDYINTTKLSFINNNYFEEEAARRQLRRGEFSKAPLKRQLYKKAPLPRQH